MKWRRFIAACTVLGGLLMPAVARADPPHIDEPEILHDARTEGYQPKAQVEKESVALMWLLFLSLSVASMAVLFKDARRTHLD